MHGWREQRAKCMTIFKKLRIFKFLKQIEIGRKSEFEADLSCLNKFWIEIEQKIH